MKRTTIANMIGSSSTGSPHGLLVERESDDSTRITITGHDGRKRHAAVILHNDVLGAVIDQITDSLSQGGTDDQERREV